MGTRTKSFGFTIVELLIVVVVIAILAAVAIVSYNGVIARVKESVTANELRGASTKLEAYKTVEPTSTYPSTLNIAGIDSEGNAVLSYNLFNNGASYCLGATNGSINYRLWSTTGTTEPGTCIPKTTTAAIAKDSSGNLYALNYDYGGYDPSGVTYMPANVSLVKYDPSLQNVLWVRGSHGTADGQMNATYYPWGVFVDPQDNVWVADSGNHRFQKFDSNGNFLFKIGGPTAGSAVGQFNTPYGATFTNDGHVWLSDRYNHRILKYTLAGAHVQTIPTTTGSAVLNQPHGMYVDASQNLYVVSRGNHRIYKYNSSGAYVSMFGTGVGGDAAGQLNSPTTMLLDPNNGDVYVYEINNRRISVFSSAGTYLRQFTTLADPVTYNRSFSMIWDNDTILLSVQSANDNVRIQRFAKDGTSLEFIRSDVIRL